MSRIIGIAGTAKNTGKTTATMAIMEKVFQKGIKLGLTSIGYDGETLDNVTGLPKPRITMEKGNIVAIADKCIEASTAEIEILEVTNVRSALGRIVIGEIKEPGLVVIAGPNKSSEVRIINQYLQKYGCQLIMVDGAINRIAPMVETEGLLLATGASRTPDINQLAEETYALSEILNIPVWEDKQKVTFTASSLLSDSMVKDLLAQIKPETEEIFITGVIGVNSFHTLFELGKDCLKDKTLVLTDPIKLVVAGDPDRVYETVVNLEKNGTPVRVKKNITLLAITINPFYPKYRFVSNDYEPAYVDKHQLKEVLTSKCNVPTVNVVEEGVDKLWEYLGI